jgi:hypothetical protein
MNEIPMTGKLLPQNQRIGKIPAPGQVQAVPDKKQVVLVGLGKVQKKKTPKNSAANRNDPGKTFQKFILKRLPPF